MSKLKKVPRIKVTDALLKKISHEIIQHFHPSKIILFGSQVWGKPSFDSDVDLLVIMESDERPALRASRVRHICRPRFMSMDILVRTPQEIKARLDMNDFFIKTIIEKGRVLYEKTT